MKKTAILACAAALLLALCACGGGKAEAKPLSQVYEDITSQVTLSEVSVFQDVSRLERMYGISAEQVAEFAGCVNRSGVEQEEIVLVKAADEAAAGAVRTALENRLQAKYDENRDYNAEQAAMIEKCSVEQHGLYVSMIISSEAEAITAIYLQGIGVK